MKKALISMNEVNPKGTKYNKNIYIHIYIIALTYIGIKIYAYV